MTISNAFGRDELQNSPAQKQGRQGAYIVCWLLGIGSLFPWNSMLTIEDYYESIFPRYHPSRVLTIVYQPFALITMGILSYYEATINTRRRILLGFILFNISTLLVLVLDLATSGKGGLGPFFGVCIISAAFGVADAHVQGGMMGDLSYMHPDFIQSFSAGLAASGTATSVLRLVTKAVFESSKKGLRKGACMFIMPYAHRILIDLSFLFSNQLYVDRNNKCGSKYLIRKKCSLTVLRFRGFLGIFFGQIYLKFGKKLLESQVLSVNAAQP